ncbi:TRAP transporter fused permease subunit [Haloarcula sp. JP-L23]|uniref:TRAP transporter permease n=1 Tax=Haloarcula sp. JP-L23 TaxID=2716717 RepID=UPI00140F351C|nr:TRAP transporter fused permease subunit [Haloarcula sp. JP-L23]
METGMTKTSIRKTVATTLTSASGVLTFVMALWVILFAFNSLLPQRQHANIVLGLGLAAYYFMHAGEILEQGRESTTSSVHAAVCVLLGLLTLAATTYVHVSYFRWLEQGRLLIYSGTDLLVGLTLIYAVTDATFRKYGTVLGLVVVGTILYALLGAHLPGTLGHSGLTAEEIIQRQTITLTGIYGFLLQVGATWIAIFIIFAGLIEGYGGFEYIKEVGDRIKEHSRSGVAQSAVITSMFMGTMMGSAASNVATTGSFTIPLMDEHGIPPRVAAAIESVASTGGQILPPIMGTAAFLMANILGVSFSKIAIAGVIPAFLFYAGTSIGIHFLIVGQGWYGERTSRGQAEGGSNAERYAENTTPDDAGGEAWNSRWNFLARGLQYIVPLLVLIYVLVIRQSGPLAAGLYTISTAVLARGVRQGLNRNVREFLSETVRGLRAGGENLAPFLAILASLGIVINLFSVTGLAQRIAFEMVDIAGGNFFILLIITMVVCLLLGLGMPTPAAYVLVATILAPVLTAVGVTEMSAHFYIFYFALLSALTPPVALAVTVAMSISGTDFVETAKAALTIGGPTYVIPFMFVTNPQLLEWAYPTTLFLVVTFTIAMVALVVSLTGFNLSQELSWPARAAAFGLFLTIAFAPVSLIQLTGVVGFIALLVHTSNISLLKIAEFRPS